MSSANPPPGKTPDPGTEPNGHDPSASAAQGTAASGSEGTPNPTDRLARIRTDPEFAVEQYRLEQGRATRAAQELKTLKENLGDLDTIIQQGVRGDVIHRAIQEYQVLTQDPRIAQALQTYRSSGKLEFGSSAQGKEGDDVNEEYLSDSERMLLERNKTLEERLQRLEGTLTEQATNLGVSSLSRHLDDVFTDLGLEGERAQQVREALTQQVNTWQSSGEAGAMAIRDLQHPAKGKGTVELLVMRALGSKGLLETLREKDARTNGVRARLATDGPSGFGTTGDEPPPEHNSIVEAISAAKAHPEVLERY